MLADFARTKGAKDKKERKKRQNFLKSTGMTGAGAILGAQIGAPIAMASPLIGGHPLVNNPKARKYWTEGMLKRTVPFKEKVKGLKLAGKMFMVPLMNPETYTKMMTRTLPGLYGGAALGALGGYALSRRKKKKNATK